MADSKDRKPGPLDNLFNAFKATLTEAVIAFTVVAILNGSRGVPFWVFFPAWFVLYMGSCFFFTKRSCWWCVGKKESGDGRGNLRDYNCWICGGTARRLRWGARIWGKTLD